MIVCDTHALIFDALAPDRLGTQAARAISSSRRSGSLACADISLWEIAMLMEKGRLKVDLPPTEFLAALISGGGFQVLPITPIIAAIATSAQVAPGDPADRLIAATALVHGAPLVTQDRRLTDQPGLETIW